MRKIIFLLTILSLVACQTLPTSSEWLARGDGYFNDGKIDQDSINRNYSASTPQANVSMNIYIANL